MQQGLGAAERDLFDTRRKDQPTHSHTDKRFLGRAESQATQNFHSPSLLILLTFVACPYIQHRFDHQPPPLNIAVISILIKICKGRKQPLAPSRILLIRYLHQILYPGSSLHRSRLSEDTLPLLTYGGLISDGRSRSSQRDSRQCCKCCSFQDRPKPLDGWLRIRRLLPFSEFVSGRRVDIGIGRSVEE